MIVDFNFYNPTKIYFGKTSLENLCNELDSYGKNVLLLYGKGSIKKIGLYDKVIEILNTCNKTIFEFSGIKPNPTYKQVLEGAKLVREEDIDLILAVGGGSVIDCAKAISVSAYAKGDPWERFWINGEDVDNKIIPVGTVLTMTGTASEMNGGSVITNEDLSIKTGRVFPSNVHPKFSILNPEYTFSVPKIQMVSGIFDIFSHLMEQYFSGEDDNTSDYVIEGIMKSLINSSRIAVKDPNNYEARSNIMWCSTMALNYISGVGKEQDWEVHNIEHQLGAYTDCPHGLGLAVISIPYYNYICEAGLPKFVRFAKNVWGIEDDGLTQEEIARWGLVYLENFIRELGIPTTLRELGATEEMIEKIARSSCEGGHYKFMKYDDILRVLKTCY